MHDVDIDVRVRVRVLSTSTESIIVSFKKSEWSLEMNATARVRTEKSDTVNEQGEWVEKKRLREMRFHLRARLSRWGLDCHAISRSNHRNASSFSILQEF